VKRIRARPGTALLLDAAGTLLHPRELVAETYARVAKDQGTACEPAEVATRFPEAMRAARPLRKGSSDWIAFWREVVRRSTGSSSDELFSQLYASFALPNAWTVAEGAAECCASLRERGMRVGVVSNWDVRLRPLLEALGLASTLDIIVVSGEELIEKPDRRIFEIACRRLDVEPGDTLHVGDSPTEDIEGARAAGCHAWLWGVDVSSFDELARRLGATT